MYKVSKRFKLCDLQIKSVGKFFVRKNCGKAHETCSELDPGYVPHKVEENPIGDDYFLPPITSSKPFSIVLPPPNITGNLHLGHALTATVQDVLVRWNRMLGRETMWVPGVDHAGIATQVVVEKRLRWENRHGQTGLETDRRRFEEAAWRWKGEKTALIEQQLRRLNLSLNWDRQVFTLDEKRSKAVQKAFVNLFDSGLIYRADHLVNWSCALRSAISDIEVEHINIDGPTDVSVPGYETPVKFGMLTKFAYKFQDSDEEIVVATTRPETMLGDVAVAVHPKDERYSRLVGRRVWHPFRNEPIPIICDDFVDPEFGTGAVKVTPGHDPTDFDVGRRHNLESLQVIDERGHLTSVSGEFEGTRRFDARSIILDRLGELRLLRGSQEHKMIVPTCSRSGDVIEFLVRPQWFVKCDDMAARALNDVTAGRLTIQPKHFHKIWFNWLENIRDWCISRQLWWGHRIPAYSCYNTQDADRKIWVAAESVERARLKASEKLSCRADDVEALQDEDVLDTWFSSALQPFTAFDWPKENEDYNKYYPLSLMETGHDILFFWVARMVMLGTQLTGKLPFNKILLHGIICDAQGRKMSKSLGNVIAPEDVIAGSTLEELESGSKAIYAAGILSEEELGRAIDGQKKMFPKGIPECGADALRFTMLSHNAKSHFISFDVNECYTNKLFCNKIWQATKFTILWYKNVSKEQNLKNFDGYIDSIDLMDTWILSRLSDMVENVNMAIGSYDFHVATAKLKQFLYYDFCDVYLEAVKRGLRDTQSLKAAGHCYTLLAVLDVGLRALAPFMPALSQHLHRHLPGMRKDFSFPQELGWKNEILEKEVANIMEIVVAIRRLKNMFNIVAKHKPEVNIVTNSPTMETFSEILQDLSGLHKLSISNNTGDISITNAVKDNVEDTSIYLVVPEELRKALIVDLPKIEKKKEKLVKELEKINKMVSGATYKINASLEAQESHAKKVATLEEKLTRISYIQSLSKQ